MLELSLERAQDGCSRAAKKSENSSTDQTFTHKKVGSGSRSWRHGWLASPMSFGAELSRAPAAAGFRT